MKGSTALFAAMSLDRARVIPLHRQLYDELRAAIVSRRLAAGARLPASRPLAKELGVSRNTVTEAFDQLVAEGYLSARSGAGTVVVEGVASSPAPGRASAAATVSPRLSRRGRALASIESGTNPAGLLCPGVPSFDRLPLAVWANLLSRRLRQARRRLLNYGEPLGYLPLREAIAQYVRAARGVRCAAEQVVIVSGAQHGLDLAARVLLDPHDAAWIEDPGYIGARAALVAASARLVPVPVDEGGLDVAAGRHRFPRARLAYITPSHQYPMGVAMPIARRLELLEWAAVANAYVIEDDYDSEFRYEGRPLPALQGLDDRGRVLYLGTLSKVLFPSLRVAYLVVPASLLPAFARAQAVGDSASPLPEQAALADFITAGHFSRHVRRARVAYARRQHALLDAIRTELSGLMEANAAPSGLHVVGWLLRHPDDRRVAAKLMHLGIGAPPLSAFALSARLKSGLVLGYGDAPAQIRSAVKAMATALRRLRP